MSCTVHNCTDTGQTQKVTIAASGDMSEITVELCDRHRNNLQNGRLVYSRGCNLRVQDFNKFKKPVLQSHQTDHSKFDFILQ